MPIKSINGRFGILRNGILLKNYNMKYACILMACLLSLAVSAQDKFVPVIQKGSKLNYVVYANGQEMPLLIAVDSSAADYVKLSWDIQGLGKGGWVMKKASLDNAKKGWWDQPMTDMDMEIADDQNVLYFSRANWASILQDKKAEFDRQIYSVQTASAEQQLKLDGKTVDAILLQNQSGDSRIWLLNSATAPIILKIEGNSAGPDLEIRSVE